MTLEQKQQEANEMLDALKFSLHLEKDSSLARTLGIHRNQIYTLRRTGLTKIQKGLIKQFII